MLLEVWIDRRSQSACRVELLRQSMGYEPCPLPRRQSNWAGRERGISEIEYAYSTGFRFFERFSIWFLRFLNVF
jgi:hypothetical protein